MQTTQRETPGFSKSKQYREYAVRHLANGVSSTPRTAQRPVPVAMDHAHDAILTDVDGNRYIDYTMGYGPLILGHNPPEIMAALKAEIDKGRTTRFDVYEKSKGKDREKWRAKIRPLVEAAVRALLKC